jgi:antitoxin (DNA-binding transcriptional repressor) of toxin-antitoxin stability system
MKRLSIQEARAEFGNLVIEAQHGQATVILRYGKPAAMVTAVPDNIAYPPCRYCLQALQPDRDRWAPRWGGSLDCPSPNSPDGAHRPHDEQDGG